jgi:hypothetical protein
VDVRLTDRRDNTGFFPVILRDFQISRGRIFRSSRVYRHGNRSYNFDLSRYTCQVIVDAVGPFVEAKGYALDNRDALIETLMEAGKAREVESE